MAGLIALIFELLDRGIAVAARVGRRFGVGADFIRFGIVGGMGFVWDTGTLYALKSFIGLYAAGTASYIVAASANWAINRAWTFRHVAHGAVHTQWARFMVTNLVGFVVNRGALFSLVALSAVCRHHPVLGVIAGSALGLGFNFYLSKRFVFADAHLRRHVVPDGLEDTEV